MPMNIFTIYPRERLSSIEAEPIGRRSADKANNNLLQLFNTIAI